MSQTVKRICKWCRKDFQAFDYNVKRGWGLFCCRKCSGASMKAAGAARRLSGETKPKITRWLRDDEPIPTSPTRRYTKQHGYVVCRWKISKSHYVECYEHRVIAGRPNGHVHHKDGHRDNNDPNNLESLSPADHVRHHLGRFDVDVAISLFVAGYSTPQIGKYLSVNPATIYRALKKRGYRRSFSEAHRVRIKGQIQDVHGGLLSITGTYPFVCEDRG
jgi:hypothetical protein